MSLKRQGAALSANTASAEVVLTDKVAPVGQSMTAAAAAYLQLMQAVFILCCI